MQLIALPIALVSGLLFACSSTTSAPQSSVARDAQGLGPQFYEVTGHGASAYLFGTVHMSHELTRNLPAPVEDAFALSDALYVEMAPTKEARAEMLGLALLEEGTTLDAVVGEELWKTIGDSYENAGQSRETADELKSMRPWAAASMIAALDSVEVPADDGPVLDRQFSLRAAKRDMDVRGLETVSEQLAYLKDLTPEEEIESLRDVIDSLGESDEDEAGQSTDSIDVWYSGDPQRLYGLLEKFGDEDPVKRAEQVAEIFVRNERMILRLDDAMRNSPGKTLFVAVGALHLPSPPDVDVASELRADAPRRLGFVDLLRDRGYAVKRLNALR